MSPSILIVAGEASGDAHGAGLIRAACALDPSVRFFGIGGRAMREAGADILLDAGEIAVVGLFEVLGRLPRIFEARRLLRRALLERRPSQVLLIDYPDFNLRFARDACRAGVRVAYFVSPQVWAWRPGRIATIARRVGLMMVIFPFEEAIYRSAGVPVSFVGHPLVDSEPARAQLAEARVRLGLAPTSRVLALLPGSRRGEVARLLPVQIEAASRLRAVRPDLQVIVPVASTVPTELVASLASASGAGWLRRVEGRFHDVLDASDAAVVASGTATLQAGFRRVPMVVIYRIHPATAWIGRRLIRLRDIGLVNLVAGERIVPELVQERCSPAAIASEIAPLLDDPAANAAMRAKLAMVAERLGPPGAFARAAALLLEGSSDRQGA